MKPLHLTLGAVAAVAAAALLAFGAWSPAFAQKAKSAKTPDSFSYEIRNGRRVPKDNRILAADGSWKAESKSGECSTVRQMTPSGEYRETRKCE